MFKPFYCTFIMVMTHHGCGYGFISGFASALDDVGLHDLFAAEVLRVALEEFPNMFGTINEELIAIIDECAYLTSFFPNGEKFWFTTSLFRDRAKDWWCNVVQEFGAEAI